MIRKNVQQSTAPRTLRRTFAAAVLLFAVCLVLAGPAAAGGIEITSSGATGLGEKATYSGGTLTLNGGEWDYINVTGVSDLTLVLNGMNNIAGGVSDHDVLCGIQIVHGNLTIQDSADAGTLVIDVNGNSNYNYTTGIITSGNITISSGTVYANSTTTATNAKAAYGIVAFGNFTISGGAVYANASGGVEAEGIFAQSISITGGSVTAAVSDVSKATGISANYDLTISDSAQVTAEASGNNIALGISSCSVLAIEEGAQVTANVTAVKLAAAIHAVERVTISDSTVKADAGSTDANGNSYGICVGSVKSDYEYDATYISINECGYIIIDGGSVETTTKGVFSVGIFVEDIEISADTVKVKSFANPAEDTPGVAFGIFATDLEISGGKVLTGAAGNYATSIVALEDLTISGGDVLAEAAGDFAVSIAVYQDFTIKNSIKQIIAKGRTQAILAGEVNAPYPVIKASTDYAGTNLQVVSAYAVSKESSPYKYVLIVPGSSSGGSTDTGSGNYAEYPRQADGTAGEIDFGTSKEVKAVDLPEGVTGEVRLIVESDVKGPEDKEVRNVFEINIPNYPAGKPAVIKFELTLEEIQAKGFTGADVCLYHYDTETGVWTKLPTTYRVADGKVFFESVTTAFSPFAVVYEIGAATPAESDEPVVPDTPVTPDADNPEVLPPIDTPVVPETPASPAPVLAVLAGLGAALVLRRK